GRVNRIRHENPALQSDADLMFHSTDNPELICYSKYDSAAGSRVVVVVNLDPNHTQSGWVDLDLAALGLEPNRPYQMWDMLADAQYLWHSGGNFVRLDPQTIPAHIFRARQ